MRGTEITDIRIFYNHPEYNHKHPIIYKDYLDLGGSKNTVPFLVELPHGAVA